MARLLPWQWALIGLAIAAVVGIVSFGGYLLWRRRFWQTDQQMSNRNIVEARKKGSDSAIGKVSPRFPSSFLQTNPSDSVLGDIEKAHQHLIMRPLSAPPPRNKPKKIIQTTDDPDEEQKPSEKSSDDGEDDTPTAVTVTTPTKRPFVLTPFMESPATTATSRSTTERAVMNESTSTIEQRRGSSTSSSNLQCHVALADPEGSNRNSSAPSDHHIQYTGKSSMRSSEFGQWRGPTPPWTLIREESLSKST
ncbi:hypothetical protein BJV82DRAFT_625118 [Fennellomyces sp. T-0311]|nr:hypothetical protein BJV82DRAFT_625118 [Fennellomyces sp. T-0311]